MQTLQTKLGIIFNSKTRKNYLFRDPPQREAFAQRVQATKVKHGAESLPHHEQITLFVGTFNMGEAEPPQSMDQWIRCQGDGFLPAEPAAGSALKDFYA